MSAADKAFSQFVDQVLGLQRHLAGDIEPQGVWPVLVDDCAQAQRRLLNGDIDGCLHRIALAFVAQEGVLHAT
ncbi:hypothetical protein D3C77_585350 [compost metagenome]